MGGINPVNGADKTIWEQTPHQTNTPGAYNTGGGPSIFGNLDNSFDGATGTGAMYGYY